MPSTFGITAVTATGSAMAGAPLAAGATLTLTLATAATVNGVTPGAGGATPTLSLGNGATATYTGYGATGLTFVYAVQAGQDIADLVVTGLSLNGASVTHGADSLDPSTLATASGRDTGLIVDTTAPSVTLALSAGTGAGNHALATDAATGAQVLNAAAFAQAFRLGGRVADANPSPLNGAVVIIAAADGHTVPTHAVLLQSDGVGGSYYAFRIDAPGTVGGANQSLAAALTDGTYTVTGATVDAAGNIATTAPQSLIVDTTADAGHDAALVLADAPDHLLGAAAVRAVRFTVSGLDADASALATFSDGTHTATAAVGANGGGTIDLSGLDGTVTATLAIADGHGNTAGAAGGTLHLDVIAPVLQADAASGKGLATALSGNVLANDGDAAALHVAGIEAAGAGTVAVPPSGTASVVGAHGTLTLAADGGYGYRPTTPGHDVFVETVTDAAGNASRTTLTFDVSEHLSSVFRFYDTVTGDHFYTTSAAEKAQIQAIAPGLAYEGVAFAAPEASPDTIDVFRFFDTVTKTHFFTTDAGERAAIASTLPTFVDEGVAFEAYRAEGADGTAALERFYNATTGQHHFALAQEAEGIRHGAAGAGWVDEGKAFVVHVGAGDLIA